MWSDHLDRAGLRHTIIENQITRFMLVHICGHYEVEIVGIISSRVQRSGDSGVVSYVESTLDHRAPVHPSSLRGVLKRFGTECLDRFHRAADDSDLWKYRNMVENRNRSAHGKRIQVTFDEVCTYHAGAKRVIGAFGHALDP